MLAALKALCRRSGRKHYVFMMGKLNAAKLANFAEVGEPLLILILYLALWIGIIKIGGWKLSPNVGIALMVAQGFYTTWTLLRNVPVDAPIIDW